MRNDTSSRLAAVALISAILLGATAAVGYMLNIQTARAVEVGNTQVQIQVQGSGSDGGGGSGNSGSGSEGGGQGSGSDGERDGQDSNGGDNGQGRYCYSAAVTNPFTGKTRTVDVCFDSQSDCEQAQQHDPDSASGCETQ